MKTTIHKIASLLLIPVVLFSTMSFGMSKHVCMDEVYSISYAGDAEDCGMEMGNYIEDLNKKCSFDFEDNCCSIEKTIIKGANTTETSNVEFNLSNYSLLTFFIISKYNLFQGTSETNNLYRDYSPPKVTINRSVLYQVFTI